MLTRKLSMALAMAVALALTGCPDRGTQGGGGGGAADQAQGQDRDANVGRDIMMGTSLKGSARHLAEAYARAPWVHANLAAGDWKRADTDLQFISDRVGDLQKDKGVSAAIQQKIGALVPLISLLDGQIGAKNVAAIQNAGQLVSRMGSVMGDKQVLAWFGGQPTGGGAGVGIVGPKLVGPKIVGEKKVGEKLVGPKMVGDDR